VLPHPKKCEKQEMLTNACAAFIAIGSLDYQIKRVWD
jgi:hypothetical protein